MSEQAYGAYARGALLEATGDTDGALGSYTAAVEADPDSVELWTRLGLLRCRLRRPGSALDFERAQRLDAQYEPLWRARAECELSRGRPKQALPMALAAVRQDPERVETSLLLVRLYERLDDDAEAERWLDALAAMHPGSIAAQRALADYADRHDDQARRLQAKAALHELLPHTHESGTRPLADPITHDELDRQLLTATRETAEKLALRARVPPGELALRAVALGRLHLGLDEADWMLAADASDADAWVAALVAADLLRDQTAFEDALGKLRGAVSRPIPLGARLLAELLARRVGPAIARRWLQSYGSLPKPEDALARRVAKRLERALAASAR